MSNPRDDIVRTLDAGTPYMQLLGEVVREFFRGRIPLDDYLKLTNGNAQGAFYNGKATPERIERTRAYLEILRDEFAVAE